MMARGLTPLKVENARANSDQRKEIADPGKPGLYLVIQPSGKKSWAVRYRRLSDKAPRKFTLDGFPSLGIARKLAQKVLDEVAEGKVPAAQKQIDKRVAQDRESDEFADVVVRFIERDQKPNRTWKETARILGLRENDAGELEKIRDGIRDGITDKWGKRPIGEIQKREIIDLLDGIAEDAPVMANRTLAALKRLFNWTLEKAILTASPCAGLAPPGGENSRRRVLSDEEIALFWSACDKLDYPFGPASKLLLLTGARRSEVGEMTRGEVKGDTWTIPRSRSKNNEPHTVPLSSAALEVLGTVKKIKGERGYIFTTTGDTPVSGWSKAKREIDELMLAAAKEKDPKAEIEAWRLHDLRRTVASGMARLGIRLEVIEKCLNHVSGSFAGVTGVYQLHSFEKEKREALAKWAEHVEEIVSGKTSAARRRRA
jgi:integrase